VGKLAKGLLVSTGASPSSPHRARFLWRTLPLPPRGWAAPAPFLLLLLLLLGRD